MSENTGRVIMLAGPVGAGKTTVSRELVKLMPAPVSYIEGDRFWPMITKPAVQDRRQHFRLLMRAMTAAARPAARSGYTVLLDFSIPPYFLESAQKILKDVPLDYVVLRPSVEVCASRALARNDGFTNDYEPYRSFYALFEDAAPQCTVSDDEADPHTQAQRIIEGLSTGAFRIATPV
jgi:chloramphenicol 3-O-phosphotransferase